MGIKQVIIIRKDLNMRKGKMVAQGAHASMKVFFDLMGYHDDGSLVIMPEAVTPEMTEWMDGSFTKICVSATSEQHLLELYTAAKEAGLPCSLIQDAGKTEFKEPTFTAVAIGPAQAEEIDEITGDLPLL